MLGYLLPLNTIGITLLRISHARAAILIDSQLTPLQSPNIVYIVQLVTIIG